MTDIENIENIENNIESLENSLEKAKAELEFSKFLSCFEEFIPDPKGSAEYNYHKLHAYRESHPNRIVQFFLKGRQFFISERCLSSSCYSWRDKARTITIPIDKKNKEFLKDLKDVLEKHKDTLGPITNQLPE
jgi:hypothetical protein